MMTDELMRNLRRLRLRTTRTEATPRVLYLPDTYTPTYGGSTTAGVTTYSEQAGFYRRVAEIMFFSLTITWTAATGTGNARILLPATSANVTSQNFGATIFISGVTFANSTPLALIGPNVLHLRLFSPLTNAANTEVAVEAAGTIAASGWYLVT